jgi:hypothetical protein
MRDRTSSRERRPSGDPKDAMKAIHDATMDRFKDDPAALTLLGKWFQAWELELTRRLSDYRNEARRCRALAKAILDGMDTQGALAVWWIDREGRYNAAVCSPTLDEHNLGDAIIKVINEVSGVDHTIGHYAVTGTGEDNDA